MGMMINRPAGIFRRGLVLGVSVLFSLHECFLISMMRSPSLKEISPSNNGFSLADQPDAPLKAAKRNFP